MAKSNKAIKKAAHAADKKTKAEEKRKRSLFNQRSLPPRVGFLVLALVAVLLFAVTYFRLSGTWETTDTGDYIMLAVACAVFSAVSMVLLEAYLYFEKRELLTRPKRLFTFAALIVLTALFASVSTIISYAFTAVLMAVILCGILCSRRAAYTMTLLMALFNMLITVTHFGQGSLDEPAAVALAVLVGGVVSVLMLNRRSGRMLPLIAGTVGGAAAAAVLAAVEAVIGTDVRHLLTAAAWMFGGCLLSGILATGLLPLFESIFDVVTDARLNELMNNNNPLLKRLMLEAPGTYHHSLIVAVMAESAAELVGANPLLVKTAAYYHDVGKLVSPRYFKENQGEYNIHDELSPIESAKRITAHPKDGAAMLTKNKFPTEIIRMVASHHGNSQVGYFYFKAKEQAEDPSSVNIADYSYDAPKPRTKEDAILMMADCCEAAVRAIKRPTQEMIEERVKKIIANLWLPEDAQLSECPLTAKDVRAIESSFIKNLLAQYHERIEYPSDKPETPPAEEKPAEEAPAEQESEPDAEAQAETAENTGDYSENE